MPRLFVAIDLPEPVKDRLDPLCRGVPGARWVRDRQFHLTLRFLGEVEGPVFASVSEALRLVHLPPFELGVHGVGHFPPRGRPRVLWAGVAHGPGLLEAQRQVERVLRRAGLPPAERNFAPHVTLARLNGAPLPRVVGWLEDHAALATEAFRVERFELFSSVPGREGSQHVVEETYPLFASGRGETATPADLPPPPRLS